MAGKSLPVTFAGGTWPNRREFARAFGISPEAFTQLVSKAERRKQPLAAEDIYAAVVAARAWHGPGADEDAVWASVLELIGSRARPELRKDRGARGAREDDLIRAACGGPPSPEGEGKGTTGSEEAEWTYPDGAGEAVAFFKQRFPDTNSVENITKAWKVEAAGEGRWRFRGDRLNWIVEPAKERLECWEGHKRLRVWEKGDWHR